MLHLLLACSVNLCPAMLVLILPLWSGWAVVSNTNAPKGQGSSIAACQKIREGYGCPKSCAGRVFQQFPTLLENSPLILRQHEMLSLPRFGHFPAGKRPLENRPCLREHSWIFSSETATVRQSSNQPPDWKSSWRDFSEVRGGSGGSFRKGA